MARSEIIYVGLVLFAVVLLPLLLWYSPQLIDSGEVRTFTIVAHSHQAFQENIPESGYWMVSEGSAWKFWEAGTPSEGVGKNEIRVKKGEIVKLKITSFHAARLWI